MIIAMEPYRPEWPAQFVAIQGTLREILGHHASAIEHIGSTAVPGLAAKDVIDVQVSVATLDEAIMAVLNDAGWPARADFRDEFHGLPDDSPELRKYFAREPRGHRRVHVHVREAGRFNHRFALLFRDFLRHDADARREYERFKQHAAAAYPNDVDGYLGLKAPVFHLLYRMAEAWAETAGWDESRLGGPDGLFPNRVSPRSG